MDKLTTAFEQIGFETILIRGVRVLLILAVAWAVLIALRIAVRRLERLWKGRGKAEGEPPSESEKRAETLSSLLRQLARITVWVVAVLVILGDLGVQIGPILASAGIVGLAVGFGAQNLVRDVISGFFMILENQVRAGDVAVINGTGGLVEQVNFRTIVLRDLSGTVHVFPNGSVDTLANLTRGWSGYVLDIGVAYKEDVDRVMAVMREVGTELRADEKYGPLMVEDLEVFGVDAFADSAVMIKGRLKTLPIKQWEVGREYRRRLKQAFDREGIEIPFPQRTLHMDPALQAFLKRPAGSEST